MPIRWQLTLFNALAIGSILLLLGLILYFLLRGALYSGIEETARNRAVAVARDVERGESLDEEDAEEFALDGVFVVVRDGRGRILDQTTSLKDAKAEDPVWRRALASGRPEGGAAELSREGPDYVYAVPVNPPDGPARVVEAGKPYEPAEEAVRTFAGVLVGGAFAALLLSVAGAYLLARAALSPVEAVVASAREITEGDLSKRLPVAREGDEIGRLAATMNDLLSRLESAFVKREEALSRQRRFAADAGHELRTPLTSIGGYARMLLRWGLEEPAAAREAVEAIDREAGRMENLVESLLALARGDEGAPLDPRPNDLGAVTGEAVEVARATAAGKVAVEYAPPAGPVVLPFDRARLRQAVSILLDNAVKYTPKAGTVTVEARERDGRAEVAVSDTGPGIPADQLPLVFERFHRADRARAPGGAGLGLAIARQIAEAHDGKIEAMSAPGEGSTFTLSLPKKRRIPED